MNDESRSFIYPLKPCPWCKMTPDLVCYLQEETWLPHIACRNDECKIKPKTAYLAIRKTCKKDFVRMRQKIETVIDYWNHYNPMMPYEGRKVNYEDMLNYPYSSE